MDQQIMTYIDGYKDYNLNLMNRDDNNKNYPSWKKGSVRDYFYSGNSHPESSLKDSGRRLEHIKVKFRNTWEDMMTMLKTNLQDAFDDTEKNLLKASMSKFPLAYHYYSTSTMRPRTLDSFTGDWSPKNAIYIKQDGKVEYYSKVLEKQKILVQKIQNRERTPRANEYREYHPPLVLVDQNSFVSTGQATFNAYIGWRNGPIFRQCFNHSLIGLVIPGSLCNIDTQHLCGGIAVTELNRNARHTSPRSNPNFNLFGMH